MPRKPPLAPEDDQTRRFAAQPCLVPTPEAELLSALAALRHAVGRCQAPGEAAAMLRHIEAIERSLRPKPPRSAFRR